jgi:hypothetical protein
MGNRNKPYRTTGFAVLALVFCLLTGCAGEMTGMSRSEAGRGTGYATLDLAIGVLPTAGSLNPDQNLYPGLARAMDRYQFFRSIEPVAANPGKKFDLLLVCEPPGFSPEIKVLSGYSGKELFRKNIVALYGAGAGTAVRELAKVFAVGAPAHQQIVAEREVAKIQAGSTAAATPRAQIQSDVDTPSYGFPENADHFALVIGIDAYHRLPNALHAEHDARAVREHLISQGYPVRNIILLTGQDASRAGIAKHLETWLPRNVNERSVVFVYYSGHGAPDPVSGQAYLVPYDGDPQFLEDTAYPIAKLHQKLGALQAKHVILALDACFSGAGGRSVLAPGTRPLVMQSPAIMPAASLTSLTAAAGDQITGTFEEQGHGLFTYYFLKALNVQGGRGGLKEIHAYLAPKVQDEARRQNRTQTPQLLMGNASGDTRLR